MANEKDEPVQVQDQREEEEGALALGLGQGEKKKQQQEEEEEELKPWEQHSAVISIPRYDYKAPSSLLGRSCSGFLITCPIKREKSATKEAISILEKFVGSICSDSCARPDFSSSNRKRKVSSEETDAEIIGNAEKNGDQTSPEISGKAVGEVSLEAGENVERSFNLSLSLVKLTRSGLLLFTFPSNNFRHVVGTLSNILVSLGSGSLKRPLWCNRIFPIQETCTLTEKNLQIVVSKLVQEYLGEGQENLERPIKFAVGYNRRGVEETEMKKLKSTADFKVLPLLDRDSCFKIVAGAFKEVAKNSTVNLKSPEVAVLVELLPISGIPHESVVVGVSILPHELITTKPRLCVKPLVSDTKPTKRTD